MTLNKADGTGVDIPLPESVQEIILETSHYTGAVESREGYISRTIVSYKEATDVYLSSDICPIKVNNGILLSSVGVRTTASEGRLVQPIEIINEGFANIEDGTYTFVYISNSGNNNTPFLDNGTIIKEGNKMSIPTTITVLCDDDLNVDMYIISIYKSG